MSPAGVAVQAISALRAALPASARSKQERADMERRERGKSARHARRDGWRAPSQAMLKYCRHKTTPKIVTENIRSTRTQDCARTERSTAIRVRSVDRPRNTGSDIPQDIRLGRRLCDRGRWRQGAAANEQDRQRFQKTRLARSNQPFSSAVNGLTAWLVVASGRAKATGGGA
jgi:hypothetical protein